MSDKPWILEVGEEQTEFPTVAALFAHLDTLDAVDNVDVDTDAQVVHATLMQYPKG